MDGECDGLPHIFIELRIRLRRRDVGDISFVRHTVRGAKRLQDNIARNAQNIGP